MKDIPAFPLHPEHFILDEAGMTLRDYFAAKAMQAFIYNWVSRGDYPETDMVVTDYAYSMADAMMKARGD